MKKLKALFLLSAAAIALQACDPQPEQLPGGDEPVELPDDCPDGQSTTSEPCR